jgi:hypothetical protein
MCFVKEEEIVYFCKKQNRMVAIESNGMIDQQGYLKLNAPLHVRNQRVRVLVLLPDTPDETTEWLAVTSSNPAFEFLHDEAEDLYSLADGFPLANEK